MPGDDDSGWVHHQQVIFKAHGREKGITIGPGFWTQGDGTCGSKTRASHAYPGHAAHNPGQA
jgi:hypothetical protein